MFLSKQLNCLHEHILIRTSRLKSPFGISTCLIRRQPKLLQPAGEVRMFPQISRKFTGNSPLRNNETSRSCRSPKSHKFRGQGSDTTSFVVTPPLTSTELQILSFPPALRGNERRAHLSGEHAQVDKQRGSKAPKQPLKIFNPNVIEITAKIYS